MTSHLELGELFHVGIRVPDIHAAMADFSGTLGLMWSEPEYREKQPGWVPGEGLIERELWFTFSTEGPVHLELVQGPPARKDRTAEDTRSHFGIWVDDVRAATERMQADGWSLEAASASPEDGYGIASYVCSPSGILVEAVSATLRPAFERWWAGGSLA